ncbi:hypothetical protein [Frigoribacterium sp. PhB116]|uniref:hypothetical protein n=1 Tax=Frigoribacterium sp. PhB116 TaxID=2485174 RepID=UPI00105DEB77|nr:hypothetical protein [Frigoribacterium sp. PhB116]TDT64049.1 hypothetical protein EDF20_1537 [Frigoribacterium sp. PhB116]
MAYSWSSPLAVVPGDPAVVDRMAQRFSLTAESIGSAASSLRTLDTSSAESEAVAAFLHAAADLEARLSAARGRYVEAGAALGSYAGSLASALDESRPAVRDNDRAREDFDAADRLVTTYEGRAMLEPEGPAKQQYEDWAAAQELRREEARDRIATSARRLAAAHAAADAAAVVAIRRFDDATDDGLHDSLWDDLGGVAHAVGTLVGDAGDAIAVAWEGSALRDALAPGFESFQDWMRENDAWIGQVVDVLENVGAVVAILSLFVPGLGVALAALAGILALVAVLRAVSGTVSWGSAAMSVVSVAGLGAGAAVMRSATQATRSITAGRIVGLVDSGVSPQLATSWVSRSFDRARPSFGDRYLFKSFGEENVAQMLHFLRSSRPGAFADDATVLSGIRRQVMVVQLINGSDFVWSSTEAARKAVNKLSSVPTGAVSA